MSWQPIDTAPQDGTEILASDYDAIEIVSWVEPGFPLISSGWVSRDGCVMFPTWWQPLPDQPPLPATEPQPRPPPTARRCRPLLRLCWMQQCVKALSWQ